MSRERVLERLLGALEGLEMDHLENLLRLGDCEEALRALGEEKRTLAARLELLAHRLEESEKHHEAMTSQVIAEMTKTSEHKEAP